MLKIVFECICLFMVCVDLKNLGRLEVEDYKIILYNYFVFIIVYIL